MKKFLFVLFGVFAFSGAFAAGENVPTSKSYVDTKLTKKQDKIAATDGAARVLTNTGTAGEYETKGIYDSTGSYLAQTDALVDAVTMNTAVQNAIDSEFQCVEYNPNDPTDCWLMDVKSHANLLGTPVATSGASFDTKTHIFTNTFVDTRDFVSLFIRLTNQTDGNNTTLIQMKDFNTESQGTITFSSSNYQYLYIKHNGAVRDNRLFWAIEPYTTYSLTIHVLSADPTVIGGIRILLSLQRENYLPTDTQ